MIVSYWRLQLIYDRRYLRSLVFMQSIQTKWPGSQPRPFCPRLLELAVSKWSAKSHTLEDVTCLSERLDCIWRQHRACERIVEQRGNDDDSCDIVILCQMHRNNPSGGGRPWLRISIRSPHRIPVDCHDDLGQRSLCRHAWQVIYERTQIFCWGHILAISTRS